MATLAYYDVLDFPMTAGEVGQFLINPQRFTKFRLPALTDKPDEYRLMIEDGLEELKEAGRIEEHFGFHSLPGRKHLFQERIERIKLAEEKWRKARRYLFWVQGLPFVEMVLASGSLGLGHMTEESDLDVLVVSKPGRIWLTRLLVFLWFGLMGVRRRKHQKVAPNKICPNHYLTTTSLHIPFASLYNAQTYAHLVPVYVRDHRLPDDFRMANPWINVYINHWKKSEFPERVVKKSKLLRGWALGAEFFLRFFGKLPEKFARAIQKPRIKLNLPGRITVGDDQLEFHPYSVEGKILGKYNEIIASMKIFGDYKEEDSGLN